MVAMAGVASVVAHSSSTSCFALQEPCTSKSSLLRASFAPLRRKTPSISSLQACALLSSASSSSWRGSVHLGHLLAARTGNARQVKRIQGVQASLLGVGAPEALVIGVVALLVFGPKGLAEVARTLGKSLRSFQPTIKELQQVSREFKATLEQEIGLDELRNPTSYDSPPTSTPASTSEVKAPPAPAKQDEAPVQPKPYTTEDYVRITEEQAKALVSEEERNASEAAAWGGTPPVKPVAEDQAQPAETPTERTPVSEQEKSQNVESVVKSSDSVS